MVLNTAIFLDGESVKIAAMLLLLAVQVICVGVAFWALAVSTFRIFWKDQEWDGLAYMGIASCFLSVARVTDWLIALVIR